MEKKLTDVTAGPVPFEDQYFVFEIICDEVEKRSHLFEYFKYLPVGCQVGVHKYVIVFRTSHKFLVDGGKSESHLVVVVGGDVSHLTESADPQKEQLTSMHCREEAKKIQGRPQVQGMVAEIQPATWEQREHYCNSRSGVA